MQQPLQSRPRSKGAGGRATWCRVCGQDIAWSSRRLQLAHLDDAGHTQTCHTQQHCSRKMAQNSLLYPPPSASGPPAHQDRLGAVPARRPRPCIPARPPRQGPALHSCKAPRGSLEPRRPETVQGPDLRHFNRSQGVPRPQGKPGLRRTESPGARAGESAGGARLRRPCGAGSRPQGSGITLPPSSF